MKWLSKPPPGVPINWKNSLSRGIVGCWPLNVNGGNRAYDLSGNGNTGVLTNMALPPTAVSGWNPGRWGPSIAFDGSNDELDPVAQVPVGSKLSLLFWMHAGFVNGTGAQANAKLVDQATSTGNNPWAIYYLGVDSSSPAKFMGGVSSGGVGTLTSATSAKTLSATHPDWFVALTYDMSNIMLYLDGILDASAPATLTLGTSTKLPCFGNAFPGYVTADNKWLGSMSFVIFYNRALSSQEVARLYYEPWSIFDTPTVWYIPVATGKAFWPIIHEMRGGSLAGGMPSGGLLQ